MKLLTQVLPREWRTMPTGGAFTLAVCASLIGLEVIGRQSTSDVHDGLAALALVAIGAVVAARHRREPLPWVSRGLDGVRWVASFASLLRYDHGVDLRCQPPLPRKSPRAVWGIAAALLAGIGVAGAAWWAFPSGWREAGTATVYLAYLVVLLVLWVFLLVVWVVGIFVPIRLLDARLKRWLGETDRNAEFIAVVVYAVLVTAVAVAWKVPPLPVFVLCAAVVTAAVVAYIPSRPDTAGIVWRAYPDRPMYTVPFHRVLALSAGLAALVVFAALTAACGGRALGLPGTTDAMPVTAVLGAMAAWVVPGLLLTAVSYAWSGLHNDPARRTAPTVTVAGGAASDRAAAAARIGPWGWAVRAADGSREPGEVAVEVVPTERSEATEFDPQWPLKVSMADLSDGGVKERLARRDEIQLRRQFFRGLAKLFRRAALFKSPGGGGVWLAPHWWFIEGMGREDADGSEDAAPRLVGPPYHRVFPPRARQHFHAVLRATQVDMIFVEDGVGHRNVE
jgi:hypothetical protein